MLGENAKSILSGPSHWFCSLVWFTSSLSCCDVQQIKRKRPVAPCVRNALYKEGISPDAAEGAILLAMAAHIMSCHAFFMPAPISCAFLRRLQGNFAHAPSGGCQDSPTSISRPPIRLPAFRAVHRAFCPYWPH